MPGDEYCYECPEQFADTDGRVHHIFEEHMGSLTPYQCAICQQKLADFRKAKKHIESHADVSPNQPLESKSII